MNESTSRFWRHSVSLSIRKICTMHAALAVDSSYAAGLVTITSLTIRVKKGNGWVE
jgi:hypothetical protein